MVKSAGTYMVTDNATNIAYLSIVKGELPYLKIISAINFTEFQETGNVVSYKATSSILKSIESNPSQFKFEEIAVVAPKCLINMEVPNEPPLKLNVNREDLTKYISYYKEHSCEESTLLGYIAVNRLCSLSEAQSIVNVVINTVKHGTDL